MPDKSEYLLFLQFYNLQHTFAYINSSNSDKIWLESQIKN